MIAACLVLVAACYEWLGPTYFWMPSVFITAIILENWKKHE